jgi:RND family efflux transporter MFP subunit
MMSRARIVWLAIGVAALAAAGVFWWTRPIAVSVVRPHRGDAAEIAYATGFVEAAQPVAVAARLTSPVVAVLVDEGDRVRRGQALVRLDDADLRSALAQARATRVWAVLAERRALTLFAQGWVTRAARDEAVAQAAAARAAERLAADRVGQTVLRSAIHGIVVKRDIEPGELASPARTLLLLGDPHRIRITATLDERDVPQVHVGQRALVSSDAWPGRVLPARVAELTPAGDPEQRAFRARLRLDTPEPLPLGMSVEANIVIRAHQGVLLLPNGAILGDRVWTIRDGRAVPLGIAVGIRGMRASEVRGLAADAVVIDAPSATLRAGTRVTARR